MDKPPITLGELLAAVEGRWTTFPGFHGSEKFTFYFMTAPQRKRFLDTFKGVEIELPGRPIQLLHHKSSWKDGDLFWLSMVVAVSIPTKGDEAARAGWPAYEGQPWPDCGLPGCIGPETHALHQEARKHIISMCDAPLGYSVLYLTTRLNAKGMGYDHDDVQAMVDALVAEGVLEKNPTSPDIYRQPKVREVSIGESREEILRFLTGMPHGWGPITVKRHLTGKRIKITEQQTRGLLDDLVREGVLELNPDTADRVYRHKDLTIRRDYATRRRYGN